MPGGEMPEGEMTDGTPDEFRLIRELFAPLAAGYPGALGLTDDAAFITATPGFDTVATMDTMVAGVHFLPDDPADLIARKLVRVNLSDLAAKGAVPTVIMVSAAFPAGTTGEWLSRFAEGLGQDVAEFAVPLIGGDTVSTPGPLTLTLTALGRVAAGQGILRSGAAAGDDIWVTGSIGDGALGLKAIRGELAGLDPAMIAMLAGRYRLPQPRVGVGRGLIGLAHAAMDVSDGLVQDLGHICRASQVTAVIEAGLVPLSAAASLAVTADLSLLATVLTGGDDYEVLFTAPAGAAAAITDLSRREAVPVTRIGRITPEHNGAALPVTVTDDSGSSLRLERGGWRHFRDVAAKGDDSWSG